MKTEIQKTKNIYKKVNEMDGKLASLNSIEPSNQLAYFLDPRFDTYQNGNAKRIASSLIDQVDSFVYQVSTNINKLNKELRLEMLQKLKNDVLQGLDKVII